VDQVEREKFEIIIFVEPGAFEIKEPEAGQAAQGHGIKHKLSVWFFLPGIRLEIKNMDQAVSDLKYVDVTGEGACEPEGNFKTQIFGEMIQVGWF
jgi:hypothetical protein